MGDGEGEGGYGGEDRDEGDNEEREADFGGGLRHVVTRIFLVRAGADAADDAEDDADDVEELGDLDVSGGDEGLMGFIDVGCDAT